MTAPVAPGNLPVQPSRREHPRKQKVSDRPQGFVHPVFYFEQFRSKNSQPGSLADRALCLWTEEEEAKLLRLSNQENRTIGEIAEILKRKPKACSTKLWELNQKNPQGPLVGAYEIDSGELLSTRNRTVVFHTIGGALNPDRFEQLEKNVWRKKDIESLQRLVKRTIQEKKEEGGVAQDIPLHIWEVVAVDMNCSAQRCQEVAIKQKLDFTRTWTRTERKLLDIISNRGDNNWRSKEARKLLKTRNKEIIKSKLQQN